MALFTGIDTVFYQVCSMDRAVAFYGGVLGLSLLRREGNDWAEFQIGDSVLAVSGELATKPLTGGAKVLLRTEDLHEVERHLGANDVKRGRIQDLGGALSMELYDPDGNELVVIQPS